MASCTRSITLLLPLLACLACAAPTGRVDLLTDLGDDGSLVAGLSHDDPHVRWVAARGLSRLAPPEDPDAVVALADSESDPAVLVPLCFAFQRWELDSAAALLRRLAGHIDPAVRAAALSALAALEDDAETALVVSALDDTRPEVRGAAALALFRLDGRRFDHPRGAEETVLDARDAALARLLLEDRDRGVRWRAAYALGGVRPRPGQAGSLRLALERESQEPLVSVFALRGLAALHEAGHTDALPDLRRALAHADSRVVLEAHRQHGRLADYDELAEVAAAAVSPQARRLCWQALGPARERAALDRRATVDALLTTRVAREDDPVVRREALAMLAGTALDGDPEPAPGAEQALARLARSEDRRDRAAAADLLAQGLEQTELFAVLLEDPEPMVRAALMPALALPLHAALLPRLEAELSSEDVAVRGQAATAVATLIREGRAPPRLVEEAARRTHAEPDFVYEDTTIALAEGFGLPPLDPVAPERTLVLPLLDRLLLQDRDARRDPEPRVALHTAHGRLVLRLDRVHAPVHVSSFLQLAEAGVYDGLDIHRAVPNFVVQGLDPRGDGWGTAERRVPDEFGPVPFVAGTVGMPHSGRPHTGGCQVFITLVPTPHLDGAYTAFGRVEQGKDVLARLQVGDVIERVERLPDT